MRERITIAVIGCGRFARNFVPLFKAHPDVDKVYVCDLIKEKQRSYEEMFDVEGIDSFEDVLKNPKINSVAIITQRHLHGPLVIAALKAGKHVYSAVPTGFSIEEIFEIEELVRKTRLTYSSGETGFYRACSVFCRDLYARGVIGDFVYGESQYNHDMRNMYGSFRNPGEADWKKNAGLPPTYYPTHSVSMILGCMPGSYVKKVSAMGWVEKEDTDIFGYGDVNWYGNPFSNTAMLCQLSNGGVARISENRRVAWHAPESYISQFFGTKSSYEFSVAHHYLSQWLPCEDVRADGSKPHRLREVTDWLLPESVAAKIKDPSADHVQIIANGAGFTETSPVQPTWRLPAEFNGMRNGHNGCHHFMVDDFCKSVAENRLSPTNIWQAARFNLPGIVAFQSALKGGELMDVPDLGDPPADWKLLRPDGEYGTNRVVDEILSDDRKS